MQAEAWHQLWPVLVELGVNEKCPTGTGLESAIEFVRELRADNARLTACLSAFVVDPATLTPDEAAAVYEQWQADWDQAAKDSAEVERIAGLLIREETCQHTGMLLCRVTGAATIPEATFMYRAGALSYVRHYATTGEGGGAGS